MKETRNKKRKNLPWGKFKKGGNKSPFFFKLISRTINSLAIQNIFNNFQIRHNHSDLAV